MLTALGFTAHNQIVIGWFQILLSISTCAHYSEVVDMARRPEDEGYPQVGTDG